MRERAREEKMEIVRYRIASLCGHRAMRRKPLRQY
jgi:hypothetical protein